MVLETINPVGMLIEVILGTLVLVVVFNAVILKMVKIGTSVRLLANSREGPTMGSINTVVVIAGAGTTVAAARF